MSVDWASTGSMLTGIGTIGGGIALIVAAVLGRKAIGDIRKEKLTEREIAHAEKALTLAYKLATAISSIRSPMTTGNESEKSRDELKDTDWFENLAADVQERTIYSNIFYQRIRAHEEDYAEAYSLLPTLKAFFGQEAEDALREIIHARHKVKIYADAYVRDRGQDLKHTRTIESHIWEGAFPGEVDPIASPVEQALNTLETSLIPIIRADVKSIRLRRRSSDA